MRSEDHLDHRRVRYKPIKLRLCGIPAGVGMGEDQPPSFGICYLTSGGFEILTVHMDHDLGVLPDVRQPIPGAGSACNHHSAVNKEPPDLDSPWTPTRSAICRYVDGLVSGQVGEVVAHSSDDRTSSAVEVKGYFPNNALAKNHALDGLSASRLVRYGYHCEPKGK